MASKLQLGYPFLLLSHSSSYHPPKHLFLLLFFNNLHPSHFPSLSFNSPPKASLRDVPLNDVTNTPIDDSPSPSSGDVFIDDDGVVSEGEEKDDPLMTSASPPPSPSSGDVLVDDDGVVTEGEEKDDSLMTSASPPLSPSSNDVFIDDDDVLMTSASPPPSSSGLTSPDDVCNVPRNDVTKEEEEEEEEDMWMTSSRSGDEMEDEMVNSAAMKKDAKEVMEMIREDKMKRKGYGGGGVLSQVDCRRIIEAALHFNNSDLALSLFAAMRSSTVVRENGGLIGNWRWPRPDLSIYTALVLGLAASLRVSDALQIISDICRVGASPAEEVPFGKVVRCPTCQIAVTVVQPQQGIQIASCAKCRYQYEFVSGDIVKIDSEEISMDAPAWKRWLGFVQLLRQTIPSAVHSIVIQTPSGVTRTYRFATETPDVPAQPGERVTIALAAPSSVYREVGPFKFSPKSQKYYPGEPLCLTNHKDGRESLLVRAPSSSSKQSLLSPTVFLPLLVILASGDAASGIINPNLPQVLPVAAAASIAMGATFNSMVLPQLGLLPERMVDAISIKQQLLAQYDLLQSRIKDLKISAENEVWMLARMCQLENKIFAVGEPSYRARRNKIKRVREGLENSLRGRMELIDSYAKISSMIEIEVEMDTNVLAAEASSNAESVAKQIQQIMELENLEERWRLQAEANDEVERLLSSEPISPEDQA